MSYFGFVNGDDQSDLMGSVVYGGSSQGAVSSGTYAITLSGLISGNYNISYSPGILLIEAGIPQTSSVTSPGLLTPVALYPSVATTADGNCYPRKLSEMLSKIGQFELFDGASGSCGN